MSYKYVELGNNLENDFLHSFLLFSTVNHCISGIKSEIRKKVI